jgi:hypothetical protein
VNKVETSVTCASVLGSLQADMSRLGEPRDGDPYFADIQATGVTGWRNIRTLAFILEMS